MNFLRNEEELLDVASAPTKPLVLSSEENSLQRAVAGIYNRLGGLLSKVRERTNVDIPTIAAVWIAESGGLPFQPLRAVIRFEVHHFFNNWGKRCRNQFDPYFRFGGHNNQRGNSWENHEFRTHDGGTFSAVHHNQSSEYAALSLARIVSSDEVAFTCTRAGGCQLLISSFTTLGYESAKEMYEAFQKSEVIQVLSFLDYCRLKQTPKVGDLLTYLQARDWNNFAQHYNPNGQAQAYAAKLKAAYQAAESLIGARKAA
jgi:hypothetical protein